MQCNVISTLLLPLSLPSPSKRPQEKDAVERGMEVGDVVIANMQAAEARAAEATPETTGLLSTFKKKMGGKEAGKSEWESGGPLPLSA